MPKELYCYWSVAKGVQRNLMELCVRSARDSGINKSFHVFSDAEIEDCECYDGMGYEDAFGYEPLIYLKAGISKLLFDYFVWIDPSTLFVANPNNILGALSKSPLHVPLEVDLVRIPDGKTINGLRASDYRALMSAFGAGGDIYASGSNFWIVRGEAIAYICDLAANFRNGSSAKGFKVSFQAALGYAMHMICADTEVHKLSHRPDLWAADYSRVLKNGRENGKPWPYVCRWTGESMTVNPAIIYQPEEETR